MDKYMLEVLLFVLFSVIKNFSTVPTNDKTLIQLHVLFRHGDRTPNLSEVYPNDPYKSYTYPPWGFGQLTEAGKLKELLIGNSLRKRYASFLSNLAPAEVKAITTNYDRTKLSCQLVLTGLLSLSSEDSTNAIKNPLCQFQEKTNDEVLGDPSNFCPVFKDLYNEQATQLKGRDLYNNNKSFYENILNRTGWATPTVNVSSELYYILKSQETLGLKLPEWTNSIWPSDLNTRAADEYLVHTATTKMRRLASGHFLKKVVDDAENAIYDKTKVFLYSAHDFNTAFILILLDQFTPHIPPYGAYVTFEIHNIDGVYGFKIFYEDYSTNQTQKTLDLKKCGHFCPIEKFKELFNQYFPLPNECKKL